MTPKDPVRLADLADVPELAETLRAAVNRAPDAAAIARIAAALELPAAPVTPPNSTLPPVGPGGAVSRLAAAAKIGGVLAVVLAGAVVVARQRTPEAPPRLPAAPVFAPQISVIAPDPEPAVTAPAASDVEGATPPAAPIAAKTTEVELIARAERAVRSAPAEALSLAGQHARLYPKGELSEEREVIAIEALRALGRGDEAEARWKRFQRTYPASAYAGRLTRLMGSPSGERSPGSQRRPKN